MWSNETVVTERTASRLALKTVPRASYIACCIIIAMGTCPLAIIQQPESPLAAAINISLVILCAVGLGLYNVGDVETAAIDTSDMSIRIERKSLFGSLRIYKQRLEDLRNVVVEENEHSKKKGWRVAFVMEHGYILPITNEFQFSSGVEPFNKTRDTIMDFIKNLGPGREFSADDLS